MRISDYYQLHRTQPTLDFVDIDLARDTRLFLDPRALRLLPSEWAERSIALVQNFFREILRLIKRGANQRARQLLAELREPNETRLGLSRNEPRGRAVGTGLAADVWAALSRSQAVQSGLLEDLEDTILLVPHVDVDIVSDITTNLIRGPLIGYTQLQATQLGIPMEEVSSGALWDPGQAKWYVQHCQLPRPPGGRLLLVPKALVRRKMDYDAGDYFDDYILEELRAEELSSPTSRLVQVLKNGKTRVTKKDLREKYGEGKSVSLDVTLRRPQVLRHYREDRRSRPSPPLSHERIASYAAVERPNWNQLATAVTSIPPGPVHSSEYESAVEALLTALFYPSLVNPEVQLRLHDGRKRVDIAYTNAAIVGFFSWVGMHYPAARIFVECKNYSEDPNNPELDQLAGRFSPSRGKVGMLVCRAVDNRQLMDQRCRDTASDQRGYITVLDDLDLRALVQEQQESFDPCYELLRERFDRLVL